MSLSRLPAPEPTIFIGDPLKYHDWSIAFKTLIENKRIIERESIHYLKKCVGGPAKEAISGYFLQRSENAFVQAKALLEERYGNPFTVTEAFRDMLGAWPNISGRDGNSLRRFAYFLNQCKKPLWKWKDSKFSMIIEKTTSCWRNFLTGLSVVGVGLRQHHGKSMACTYPSNSSQYSSTKKQASPVIQLHR